METIKWIENWFKNNCDGTWEKGFGIQITSTNNPGWELEIDLSNTSLANITIDWILNEKSSEDWYGVKIDNQKFSATGDAGKLNFLFEIFKETIEKMEGL